MIRGTTTPVGIFAVVDGLRWGAVTGTTAGELLRVRYTGAVITAASIELSDGRVLELSVTELELSLLLPPDAPDGIATITATLDDDTQATLELLLHGLAVAQPQPGPPQGPIGRRRHIDTIVSPSRVVVHSGTRVRGRQGARGVVLVRSRTVAVHLPPPPSVRIRRHQLIGVRVGTRVSSRQVGGAGVQITAGARVDRRGVEEALLALGVL